MNLPDFMKLHLKASSEEASKGPVDVRLLCKLGEDISLDEYAISFNSCRVPLPKESFYACLEFFSRYSNSSPIGSIDLVFKGVVFN